MNRNIVSDIDDLFVLCDPSQKSLKHVARIRDIIKQVGMRCSHFYLVADYEFDDVTEERLRDSGELYLGKVDYDANVERYNLEGRSLLQLPEDSPACVSVEKILAKAGYR